MKFSAAILLNLIFACLGSAWAQAQTVDGPSSEDMAIDFEAPVAVAGTVVRYESGIAVGIGGALVWCDSAEGFWTRADDEGRFSFLHIPLDPSESFPSVKIAAAAPGYGRQEFAVAAGAAGSPIRDDLLDLELMLFETPDSGHFRGRVADESGRALDGVRVVLLPTEAVDERARLLAGVDSKPRRGSVVFTDSLGRFSIEAEGRDFWDLAVLDDTKRPLVVSGLAPLEPGEQSDVGDLTLAEPWILEGTVLDSERRPVDGVRVEQLFSFRVGDWSDAVPDTTVGEMRTGADGRFTLPMRVPQGLGMGVDFRFSRDGYETAELHNVLRPMDTEPEIILEALGRLSGRVLSEDDEPVVGARLFRISDDGRGEFHQWAIPAPEAVTNERGEFEIHRWPPGSAWLRIEAERFATQRRRLTTTPGESRTLTIRLGAGVALGGVVLRPTGEPVEHAVVRAGSAFAETGSTGTFEIDGLGAGLYSVHASHSEFGQALREVRLGAHDAEPVLELVLTPELDLSGRVVDEDGRPVENATVFATDAFGRGSAAYSDAEGGFRFLDLEPGRYELSAAATGVATLESQFVEVGGISGGDPLLTLVAHPRGRIEGSIRGSDRPAGQLRVTWSLPDGRASLGEVFPDLTYQIKGVRLTEGWVVARILETDRVASERVRLSTDRTSARVDLVFGEEGRAEGRLSRLGTALDGVRVSLWTASGFRLAETLTDSGGGFRMLGIREGDYSLSVELDGGPTFLQSPVTVPGPPIEWEVETGSLVLEIQGPNGLSLLSARALVRPAGQVGGSRPADCSEGVCRWTHLAPGRYTLEAAALGHDSQQIEVSVQDSGDHRVAVQLTKSRQSAGW